MEECTLIHMLVLNRCVVSPFIFNYFLGLPGRCIGADVSDLAARVDVPFGLPGDCISADVRSQVTQKECQHILLFLQFACDFPVM